MHIGPWEILLILMVVLLLFGAKRLPDLARSIGKSMRELKKGMSGLEDDDKEQKMGDEKRDDKKTHE